MSEHMSPSHTGSPTIEPSPIINWPGIPRDIMVANGPMTEKAEEVLQPVTSSKRTASHEAVIEARDHAFRVSDWFVLLYC